MEPYQRGQVRKWSHTVHPFADLELVRKVSPGQLTLQSRAELRRLHSPLQTTHTREEAFHGLAGTYTAGMPHSGNPSTVTEAWAGKPLSSLSRPSPPPAPREGSEDKHILVLLLRVATGFRLQPPQLFQRVLSSALSDTCGFSWKQPGDGSHQR